MCVCECIVIQTLIFIEFFYTTAFLNTHQIHTKLQDWNILSAWLSSKISDSTSISVCYSFQEAEAHAYLCSDFCEGCGGKMGFVGLSFLSSPLVIPSIWSKDLKASKDNGGVQTKDFIDEYFFTLCFPPGDSLNSYFLFPQGCWRWHILILVWFCDLINFLGIILYLRLYICSYTLLQLGNFLLLFSFFSFLLCTCCWLLFLLDTANVVGDREKIIYSYNSVLEASVSTDLRKANKIWPFWSDGIILILCVCVAKE